MGKPSWSHVQLPAPEYIGRVEGTWGSETSQYPQEEKTTVIPLVAASERGTAQTGVLAFRGCRARHTELQTSELVKRSGTIGHRR